MKKFILFLLLFITVACIKEKESPIPQEFTASVMTLDEGNYMSSNASMTGYNPESMETISDLFSAMAGTSVVMGDSPTSIYEHDGLCYISMSGSGKIYVFDPDNYILLHTITGLSSPRYMYAQEDMMWVSDLYNTNLTKINLNTRTICGQIEIGGCAEMLIPYGNDVFTNFWNMDKRIARIDMATGNVLETLEVGIQPSSMALDKQNGILWVYCDGGGWDGNPIGFEDPSIYKIDISTSQMHILKEFHLERTDGYSFKLAIGTDMNGYPIDNSIYFINKHVYKMDRNSSTIPSKVHIDGTDKIFYSIAVSTEGELYVSDAVDYISDGICYRFDKFGSQIDSFQTGISPGFIFIHSATD